MLKQYKDWRPTEFDASGLGLEDRADWLVLPITITRDTPDWSIDASNWAVALSALLAADPDCSDHEVHRFGHWGPGWYLIMLLRPSTECARIGASIQDHLETIHPILNEDDLSHREHKAAYEAWLEVCEDTFNRKDESDQPFDPSNPDHVPEMPEYEARDEGFRFRSRR